MSTLAGCDCARCRFSAIVQAARAVRRSVTTRSAFDANALCCRPPTKTWTPPPRASGIVEVFVHHREVPPAQRTLDVYRVATFPTLPARCTGGENAF